MFKIFVPILLSIILLEQTIYVTPIFRMGYPPRMQKIMKNAFDVSNSVPDESNNVFNTLVLRAQTTNGLTNTDKKLLASSIVDWMKENERAKQENTVYWYTRQG
jgi:hypothetical protein